MMKDRLEREAERAYQHQWLLAACPQSEEDRQGSARSYAIKSDRVCRELTISADLTCAVRHHVNKVQRGGSEMV